MGSIKKAADIIKNSANILVFTGAGISASAGVPTFRDKGGLWTRDDIVKYGSNETWCKDPWSCWFAYESFRLRIEEARPTSAHHFVRKLEERFGAKVATTNVDSLHLAAGTNALEIHGKLRDLRCMACGSLTQTTQGAMTKHPGCPDCGNWRRHDVVLWDEPVRHTELVDGLIGRGTTVILIGMSGVVTNTKEIARTAKRRGGSVIEINPSLLTPASLFTNVSIRNDADTTCSMLDKILFF